MQTESPNNLAADSVGSFLRFAPLSERKRGLAVKMETLSDNLIKQFKARRIALGLSTYQLARLMGMSQGQVSGIEAGRYGLNSRTIAKLLTALGGELPAVKWDKKFVPEVPPKSRKKTPPET